MTSIGSISLAANSIDGDDLVRIIHLYVNHMGATMPTRAHGKASQMTSYDHVILGVRESWAPLQYQCLLHRRWVMVWLVPVVARVVMEGVQPSPRVLELMWQHIDECDHIDGGQRQVLNQRQVYMRKQQQRAARATAATAAASSSPSLAAAVAPVAAVINDDEKRVTHRGRYWLTTYALVHGYEYKSADMNINDTATPASSSSSSARAPVFDHVISLVPPALMADWKKPIPEELADGVEVSIDNVDLHDAEHATEKYASSNDIIHLPNQATIEAQSKVVLDPVKACGETGHLYAPKMSMFKRSGWHTSRPLPLPKVTIPMTPAAVSDNGTPVAVATAAVAPAVDEEAVSAPEPQPVLGRVSDRSLSFLIYGGYNRGSEHIANQPGIYGYTAKMCRAWSVSDSDGTPSMQTKDDNKGKNGKPVRKGKGIDGWATKLLHKTKYTVPVGAAATPPRRWPYFSLPLHRESWAMSSINIFVGWHKHTTSELFKQRQQAKLDCSVVC